MTLKDPDGGKKVSGGADRSSCSGLRWWSRELQAPPGCSDVGRSPCTDEDATQPH